MLAQVGGTLANDTVWAIEDSPFEVTSDVTIPAGVTLLIEPGVNLQFRSGTRLNIEGRIVAEGTPDARIQMVGYNGVRWNGLNMDDTLADNRITYTDMIRGDGQGEAIDIDYSRLFLDNVTWSNTTGTILELNHPSIIVRNSQFPASPSGDEVVHGNYIEDDEYLILESNVFANSNNGGDVIDFLGAERPGPVLQVLNNVFLGGGDDGLDLDGTDAHIEGNVFMNFSKNTSRATTSNAIATGEPQSGEANRTEITVVRNLFINNDHSLLLKEDAFATLQNNVFVNSQIAAIQFNEVGGTAVHGAGKGATLSGNIFWNNNQLFKNLVDQAGFKTDLTASNNLMPDELVTFGSNTINAHDLGEGNLAGDPLFVDAGNGDFRLQAGSPARGTGPLGIDMGALVASGPRVVQRFASANDDTWTIDVGGPGVTQYRYRLDDGALSSVRDVSEPIEIPQGDAEVKLSVVGMNSAGEWYTGATAAWNDHQYRLITPKRIRSGESLPVVSQSLAWDGSIDRSYLQSLPLTSNATLTETSLFYARGVATASPVVTTNESSIELTVEDQVHEIEVLGDDFPVESITGTLVGDIVWTADREYHLTGDVQIPAGASLTIEPGVRVLLGTDVNLEVRGTFASLGTPDDPVLFRPLNQGDAWGGLEFTDTQNVRLQNTFLTGGGGDASRNFGHSNSQPVIKSVRSQVDCDGCYVIDAPGKAFGASNGILQIANSVVSRTDTGGEFMASIARISDTWVIDIPDRGNDFSDDDNDGFYFAGAHSSGEPSRFERSIVYGTKDDGLDHNGARLEVVSSWIEGADHEGLAASNTNWATVTDSVFMGGNQGVEAGYGGPDVTVTQSVIVRNQNQTDPDSPITAGLRFGDGYDGSNGNYTGHITAEYLAIHDNGDNVRNYDGTIPGSQAGAIDLTSSLANDEDATDPTNFDGVPVFSPSMHLLRASAGFSAGPDGMPVGRVVPAVEVIISTIKSPDFNDDGQVDAIDIDLLCAAIQAEETDLRFDLDGDGTVSIQDHDQLITERLQTTYGDSNLDGRFDSSDLVAVFIAGEYEDGVVGNSGWADGDWNCDGEFDTSDLVYAFQRGGYVAAAVPTRAMLEDVASALEGDPTRKGNR